MGGDDKGVVVEGLARAAKKAGSSSSSPVIVRIVGVNDGDAAFLSGGGAIKASSLRES